MLNLSKSLTLVALFATALPVYAQEAAAPAAPADLSMGTVAAEPVEPRTKENAKVDEGYLAAKFDMWEQRCVKTAVDKDPCELFQLLKDTDGNNVAEFSIFVLPEGSQAVAGATIVVPLETLLPANLTIAIDTAKPKIYPYTFCAAAGCVARVGFTAEEVAGFKNGAKATITVVPAAAPDQKVNLDLSLKGFTAGYDAIAPK